MSRAKKKMCSVHDLQSRQNDIILTKKDCDFICNALLNTYVNFKFPSKDKKRAFLLSRYFKKLTYITKNGNRNIQR